MASSSATSGSSGPSLPKSTLLAPWMKELEAQGHLDPGSWKLPKEDETVPNLPLGYIVDMEAYAICGLRLPKSEFFADVLVQCEIELVNLNPNSILILAIFQNLCECYLGFFRTP